MMTKFKNLNNLVVHHRKVQEKLQKDSKKKRGKSDYRTTLTRLKSGASTHTSKMKGPSLENYKTQTNRLSMMPYMSFRQIVRNSTVWRLYRR